MFKINKNFISLISLNQREKKAFLWIFFLSLVCLFSLLQSNQLYIDDFLRVTSGETYWEGNGRPMSSLVVLLLQLGKPLTAISPLPQIICFSLSALGIIYLARVFKIHNLLLLILSGLVCVINPYNLSLYSFIFDSLPMELGVFCSISAFYITTIGIEKIKQIKYNILAFLFSVIFLIMSLCLYQPTSSFYLVAFIFYLLLKLCKETKLKISLYNFLIYLSLLLLSFLTYIPIKNHYIEGTYTLTHSELPAIMDIPKTIIQNVSNSWQGVKWAFENSIMLYLLMGLLILLAITIITTIIINNRQLNRNFINLITSLVLAIFYYLILVCSFVFPSSILAQPVWTARIFTGFTAVIGIGCLFLAHFWSISKFSLLKYILIFYLFLIVLSFTNLSLTFGNVLQQQDVYEQRIGTLIIADIEDVSVKLSIPLDKPKITFANTEKIRDLRRNILTLKAMEKYPILSSLVYPYFTSDNFGITKFKTFGLNFEEKSNEEFISKDKGYYIPQNEPIITRQLYNIYLEKNDTFVIIFNE